MIPDNDFTVAYSKSQIEPKSHQEYFNLGVHKCYEFDFPKAQLYLTKAHLLKSTENIYQHWKLTIGIKLSHTIVSKKEPKKYFCCGEREKISKKKYLKKIAKELLELVESIESLWALIELSMNETLVKGVDIEPCRYFASRVKEIDRYFGYLAWAKIELSEKKPGGIELLKRVIDEYSDRPEGYYMAWEYYYHMKEYGEAKDIAAAAFLRVSSEEHMKYYILFCLKLAKAYYLTGRFQNCIELLYYKYLEHPNYPMFLYYFAKYCIKSEDFTMNAIAKSVLKELLRLCHISRTGCIHYWICKSFLLSKQNPEAFKHAHKSLFLLDGKEKEKISEMKKVTYEMKYFMEIIDKVRYGILSGNVDENMRARIEEIKGFHKSTGEILESRLIAFNGDSLSAVHILKNLISSSRTEINAYFNLILLEPVTAEKTFKELLRRAKKSQITTQIWVKSVVLYSKYLFNKSQYNHMFYILRLLAKVLPPLPYSKIPYCKALQKAETMQELAIAHTQLSKPLPSPINSNFILSPRKKDHINVRNLTGKIVQDFNFKQNHSPTPTVKIEKKKIKRFKKLSNLTIDVNLYEEDFMPSPSPTPTENPLEMFSICSKPKFLFYIAKFSVLLKRNKEEAKLALKDFRELLKYGKNKNKIDKGLLKADLIEKELNSFT